MTKQRAGGTQPEAAGWSVRRRCRRHGCRRRTRRAAGEACRGHSQSHWLARPANGCEGTAAGRADSKRQCHPSPASCHRLLRSRRWRGAGSAHRRRGRAAGGWAGQRRHRPQRAEAGGRSADEPVPGPSAAPAGTHKPGLCGEGREQCGGRGEPDREGAGVRRAAGRRRVGSLQGARRHPRPEAGHRLLAAAGAAAPPAERVGGGGGGRHVRRAAPATGQPHHHLPASSERTLAAACGEGMARPQGRQAGQPPRGQCAAAARE